MINNKEIYKLWAPKESIWSPWVRPVPFVFIDENVDNKEYESFNIPSVIYLNNEDERFSRDKISFIHRKSASFGFGKYDPSGL